MTTEWAVPPEFANRTPIAQYRGLQAWVKPAGVPLLPDPELGPGAALAEWWGTGAGRVVPQLDRQASGIVLSGVDVEVIRALEADAGASAAVERRFVAVFDPIESVPASLQGEDPRGVAAAAKIEVLARGPGGVLAEVAQTRGRAGALRSLLAQHGLRIVGGEGGSSSYRLMWQQRSVAVGQQRFDCPVDEDLVAWVQGRRRELAARLEQAILRRGPLYHATSTTDAFRVIHGASDDIPGMELDRYGAYALLHLRDDELTDDPEALIEWLDRRGATGVYVVRRPRDASGLTAREREDRAPTHPVRGAPAPNPLTIRENGVEYASQLGDGLSTGIFLDQRANRRRLHLESRGKRVLNLFGYTGAFAVAAASGDAAQTLTVDLAGPALRRADETLARFGTNHRTVRADVFEFLEQRPSSVGGPYDWIVCDPPTFSRSKSHRWRSGREWIELGRRLLPWLAPGGSLIACTNDRRMSVAGFRDRWRAVAAESGLELALRGRRPPLDFPWLSGGEPHLKTLEITRRGSSMPSAGRGRQAGSRRGSGRPRGGRHRPS